MTTLTPNTLTAATIVPPNAPFDHLAISHPLCYPVSSGQQTCLGYVENYGTSTIGDVTLETYMINDDSTIHQLFTLEQRVIRSDDVAPYRFQIPDMPLDEQVLQIQVADAQLSPTPSLQLRLLDMQGEYHLDDNRYEFRAQLENPTAFIATNIRLIITLENADGDIIGYRATEIPTELASGAQLPIYLIITPLETTTTIRHRITLEAFALDTSATPVG
jgi:hypothetical protein